MLSNCKAQSTIEYAVMAAVVVAALLMMQVYMQRGVAGKLRTATDQIGEPFVPDAYTASFGTHSKGIRQETTTAEGTSKSEIKDEAEVQQRRGQGGEGTTGEEHVTKPLTGETLFQQ